MNKETEKNEKKIKKENRKALKIFIPVMILATIFGGVCGLVATNENSVEMMNKLAAGISACLYRFSPYALILLTVATFLFGLVQYIQAKKRFAAAVDVPEDMEEQEVEPIERKLSLAMILISVNLIFNFMFFGIMAGRIDVYLEETPYLFLLGLIAFVFGAFANMKLTQMHIDLLKRMNPRLKGSVYDMKFQEKWMKSCDELEKLMIYRSGYTAYKAGNTACTILWVVVVLIGIPLHFGPLPPVLVTGIWLTMSLAYFIEATKLEKKKINM